MQENLTLIAAAISGISGAFIAYIALRPQLSLWKNTAKERELQREVVQKKLEEVSMQLNQSGAKVQILSERLQFAQEESNEMRKKLQLEFEQMANQLLEEKSQKFTQQNQVQVHNLLAPLQQKIQHFEEKLSTQHESQIKDQAALREYLGHLLNLNQQLGQDTLNLTQALKGDSKYQGNWGELILERVLEQSGLQKGREYDLQYATQNSENGRLIPDVILHLPDQKKLIIDSKVSLTAYERARNASDKTIVQQERKAHVKSLKNHIDQLSEKGYWQAFQPHTPDFVLLFVPVEPALGWALEDSPSLYEYAFLKQIVVVSPTTLLATLRTIDSMWKQHKQQVNAQEIAGLAAKIYDKFHGVVSDFERAGKKIEESKEAYDAAWLKLSRGKGNMISQVEKLKELGVQPKKQLNTHNSSEE